MNKRINLAELIDDVFWGILPILGVLALAGVIAVAMRLSLGKW